jgi:single-stranded DNA-binding protein
MNSVHLIGTLAGAPKPQGDTPTPCCAARLCVEDAGKDGQVYKLWVPVEAWGQAAITIGPLPEGALLAGTGRLKWKSWLKDGQKHGALVVSTWQVRGAVTRAGRQW